MSDALSAEILPTHTPALFNSAVTRAAALLRAGDLVALPTETVYGLAANAFDAEAVNKIFAVKGRPARNPIIVHVANEAMAETCIAVWPPTADALARAFWPGPLTLVLPRSQAIPDVVTAGGPTVGVRWPSHPLMQAVIRECGFPLAAPSANRSGELSPTTAQHVRNSFTDVISLIVDGGQSNVGIESTVLDLTATPPRVLRPGMVRAESIARVIGELNADVHVSERILKSPGLLERHYAPKAKLFVCAWANDADLRSQLDRRGVIMEGAHVIAHTRIPSGHGLGRVGVVPHDAEAFARAIYAELHRCDELGAKWIVVEAVPDSSGWVAIADRLQRASVYCASGRVEK